MNFVPITFRSAVENGIKTTSSWSVPRESNPFAASVPTTLNGIFLSLTVAPMASSPGRNRLSTTVLPSRMTFEAASISVWMKRSPASRDQLRIVRYPSTTPLTDVNQLRFSWTIWTASRRLQPTSVTCGSLPNSSMSADVSVTAPPSPVRTPLTLIEPG